MTKILVLNAESLPNGYLREMLEASGAQVQILTLAHDFSSSTKRWEPDLIILDSIDLQSALETCQTLKKVVYAPILVLSLDKTPERVAALLDSGADDCLAKPISKELLTARINTLTRRKNTLADT